jgi:hypothetical protein
MALDEKFRRRAKWCHRLALGIAEPKFTSALVGLAHEYETIAAEAERLARDRRFRIVEAVKFGYDLRLSAYKRKRRLSPRKSN